MGSIFVDLSKFENLIFPKKLFDFESKFPFVGYKFSLEISVENPAGHIYPVQKILGNFITKIWNYRHFWPQRWEIDPFLRPHKSKKGQKGTEGVEKGTQKFSEKIVGTLPLWPPKRLAK